MSAAVEANANATPNMLVTHGHVSVVRYIDKRLIQPTSAGFKRCLMCFNQTISNNAAFIVYL